MRNKRWIVWVVALALMGLASNCSKKEAVAGKASAEDMLRLIPENPLVLFSFDFHRIAGLELFDKMTANQPRAGEKEKQPFASYQDFVKETGIDPKKDLYFITIALYGDVGPGRETDLLALVNLTYDKQKLLQVLKNKGLALREEPYGGQILYAVEDPERKLDKEAAVMRLAFLNEWNIALGKPAQVKAAIDLQQGKGSSADKSKVLMNYVKKVNTNAMCWMVLGAIPQSFKNQAPTGAVPFDFSKTEAFFGFVDYRNRSIAAEFRLISHNEQGNKQVVDMLNGLKSMGAMGTTSKEPELAELLNGINLSNSADDIRLTLNVSEQLLNKLGEKAKAKAESVIKAQPEAGEQAPEKK